MSCHRWIFFHLVIFSSMAACAADGSGNQSEPAPKQLCTDAWYQSIEKQLPTGDGERHGPDIGSDEWKSAIERKLNVSGKPDVPARDQESWCRYIDPLVHGGSNAPANAMPQSPSFDCEGVQAGSVEELICNDRELSMLDRKLSATYESAHKSARQRSTLEAEQRGWLKGRRDCWKSEDRNACLRDAYFRRIAELQAVYRLVPGIGPTFYQCDGKPGGEVVATFFATDPRTLIAEFKGDSSLMYVVPSGSGVRYQGRNETFWEHQGEATIVWGNGAAEMHCRKAD